MPSFAPPPSFWELHTSVSDVVSKNKQISGWSIDALEEGEAGKVCVFPFADQKGMGAHVLYQHALGPRRTLNVAAKLTSYATNLQESLPIVSLTTTSPSAHLTNIWSGDLSRGVMAATATHPVVFGTVECRVLDKCSTTVTASTRLTHNAFAAAMLDYEPKRSGLRECVLLAIQKDCPNFFGGDVMAKYNLRHGFSAHVRVPLHPMADLAVVGDGAGFVAGIQARSPCGAKLMGSLNITEGSYTLTAIRNLKDIWKVTLTCTAPISSKTASLSTPRFGLMFSNMDAL